MTKTQLLGAITDLLVAGQKRTALQLRNLLLDIVNNVLCPDDNGNVGIGTSSPQDAGGARNLFLYTPTGVAIIKVATGGAGNTPQSRLDFATGTPNSYAILALNDQNGNPVVYFSAGSAVTAYYSDFETHIWRNRSAVERMRIDSSGNLLVGLSAAASSAQKTIHLANATVPTGNPSGGGVLYVENGALKYRG